MGLTHVLMGHRGNTISEYSITFHIANVINSLDGV